MGNLYKTGERCFGSNNMKRWLKKIERHYRNDPPCTADERKLRKAKEPASKAAMLLLEDAVEQTLRGILGIRTGRRRRQMLPLNLKIKCRDLDLVMEGYEGATTTFRGQTYKHEVPGIIAITCRTKDRKVQPAFVSHPFWQLKTNRTEAI